MKRFLFLFPILFCSIFSFGQKIYQDSQGKFWFDGEEKLAGEFRLEKVGNKIAINGKNNFFELVKLTEITEIQREDDSFYTSISEFETEMSPFFSNLTGQDFYVNVARGTYSNIGTNFKFGENPNLGTDEEVIWYHGGNYPFLSNGTAEFIDVVSSSANDTDQGSGAWDLLIQGLDIDGFEQQEVVILNGTTPVQTVNEYFRVNRAIVLHSGTATAVEDANQGVLTLTSTTTNSVLAEIGIHDGQTTQAVYTVPKGKTAYATGISFNIGQGKECRFVAKFRNCTDSNCAFSVKYTLTVYESTIFGDLRTPLRVPELTDIVITGKLSSTPNVVAHASFGLILIDN